MVIKQGIFITGDANHEPNGFWTAQGLKNHDLQLAMALKYSVPQGRHLKVNKERIVIPCIRYGRHNFAEVKPNEPP